MRVVEMPPSGRTMLPSMRGIGYSLETALADIIDNSISANASSITIECDISPVDGPRLFILDDGDGMRRDHLIHKAMRLGGTGIDYNRGPHDLGRFGLGLKTAGFSQGRLLRVVSRRKGETTIASWDLDHVVATDRWELHEESHLAATPLVDRLREQDSGTLVIVEKIDRFGPPGQRSTEEAFHEALARSAKHLGRVFHRYLEIGARTKISIKLGATSVSPRDPFMSFHPLTCHLPPGRSTCGTVVVSAAVIPPRHLFDGSDAKYDTESGGAEAALPGQGFYIYRADRLICIAGWMGLSDGGKPWIPDEAHRLARIAINIPTGVDADWNIDIRKSSARPPAGMKNFLRAQAIRARNEAKGKDRISTPRDPEAEHKATGADVWLRGPGGRLEVNRFHPFIESMLADSDPGHEAAERMLSLLELSLPERNSQVGQTAQLLSLVPDMQTPARREGFHA